MDKFDYKGINFPNLDINERIKTLIQPTTNYSHMIDILPIEHPSHKTNEILEHNINLMNEQIGLLKKSLVQSEENNNLLKQQYDTLKQQYDLQVSINDDNTIEIKKSKRSFWISIIVAVIIGGLGILL